MSFYIAISKSSFQYNVCIGKGGFGKVWKVDRKKFKQEYAMKEMVGTSLLFLKLVEEMLPKIGVYHFFSK